MRNPVVYFTLLLLSFLLWSGWNYLDLRRAPWEIQSITILDRDGKIIEQSRGKDGYMIPYTGSLDTPLIRAIIEREDQRYWSHDGIDIIGKIWALRENLRSEMIVRGGSTITEQYLKNTYFPLAERTYLQKMREMSVSWIYELLHTKEDILRWYLDSLSFGSQIRGLGTLESLSEKDGTHWIHEVLTRIHTPSLGDQEQNGRRYLRKVLGYSETWAIAFEFSHIGEKPENTKNNPHLLNRIRTEIQNYCSYGQTAGLEKFLIAIPDDICTWAQLHLRTAIDSALDSILIESIDGNLKRLEEKNVTNAAWAIWDSEAKKFIVYRGNRKSAWAGNAHDMIQIRRSVGSLLKPFLYLEIFRWREHDGESYVIDQKRIYGTNESEKSYISENYRSGDLWPVKLREALGNSLNTPAVALTEYLWLGKTYDVLRKYDTPLTEAASTYGYSLILGWVEASLEELIHSYEFLTQTDSGPIDYLRELLMDPRNRARTFGIQSILNTSLPFAVKTGTSTDFRDNWVAGYDSRYIIMIWVGNIDRSSMTDVTGVTGAGPIYHQIAEWLIHRPYFSRWDTPSAPQSLCLDLSCHQKILTIRYSDREIQSRPADELWKKEDFVIEPTPEEKIRWKIK